MPRYDDPRITTFGLLLEAHADLVGVLGRDLEARAGLALSSYEVLLRLGQQPDGRLRMSELAGSVALSASGLTRLVDRLEGDGLVGRERCPDDRRGAFAVLTAAGRERLEAATEVHVAGIDRHLLARLDDDELVALRGALRKLRTTEEAADQRRCSDAQLGTPTV